MSDILNDRYEESRFTSFSAYDQYRREVLWFEANALEDSECGEYLQCIERARCELSNARLQRQALDARERLVQHYQPLVFSMASRYARVIPYPVDVLDLVQEGNLGLLSAFELYVERGGDFRMHLVSSVRWMLRAFLQRGGSRLVRLNGTAGPLLGRLREVQKQLEVQLNRPASFPEIAERLGVTRERVCELYSWQQCCAMESLEVVVEREFVGDVLEVLSGECLQETVYWETTVEAVRFVLDMVLSDRQRQVMVLRYGLGEEDGRLRSCLDVACVLGVDSHSVEEVEQSAFRRIRSALLVVREQGCVRCQVKPQYTQAYRSVKEVAVFLGVTSSMVHYYIKQGCFSAESVVMANVARPSLVVEWARVEQFKVELMMVKGQMEGYYTVEQAAQRLGVTSGMVYKYIDAGQLRAERMVSGVGRRAFWVLSCQEVDGMLCRRVGVGGEQVA